jgi:hypothetical protein
LFFPATHPFQTPATRGAGYPGPPCRRSCRHVFTPSFNPPNDHTPAPAPPSGAGIPCAPKMKLLAPLRAP